MKSCLLLLTTLFVLNSCAFYQPLTEKDIIENNLNENSLKQVQFYLSSDIILQRKVGNETSNIKNGKVQIINGELTEEVVIKKGTPGILVNTLDNRIGISFEDNDNQFLMFGPNKNKEGKYYLLASEWKNNTGKVNYEGKIYFCTPQSGKAFITLNIKKLFQLEKEKRKAKGRKL
jgi:hypothetical protein